MHMTDRRASVAHIRRLAITGAGLMTLVLAATQAQAQTTCQRIGSQIYCNGPDGSYSGQRIGDMTYGRYSDGSTVTTQRIGSTSYSRSSDGVTSTTQRIGDMTYGRSSEGVTSTTQRIGDFTYTQRSDGTRTTCQRIGTSTYCN